MIYIYAHPKRHSLTCALYAILFLTAFTIASFGEHKQLATREKNTQLKPHERYLISQEKRKNIAKSFFIICLLFLLLGYFLHELSKTTLLIFSKEHIYVIDMRKRIITQRINLKKISQIITVYGYRNALWFHQEATQYLMGKPCIPSKRCRTPLTFIWAKSNDPWEIHLRDSRANAISILITHISRKNIKKIVKYIEEHAPQEAKRIYFRGNRISSRINCR